MGNKTSIQDRYYVETLSGEIGSHGFYLCVPYRTPYEAVIARAKSEIEDRIAAGLSREHGQMDKMIVVFCDGTDNQDNSKEL